MSSVQEKGGSFDVFQDPMLEVLMRKLEIRGEAREVPRQGSVTYGQIHHFVWPLPSFWSRSIESQVPRNPFT